MREKNQGLIFKVPNFRYLRQNSRMANSVGLTLIEVLVTIVIFSIGITGLYRSYFQSLNFIDHLNNRLHALVFVDNQINQVDRNYRKYKALPSGQLAEEKRMDIRNREIIFRYDLTFKDVEGLSDLFFMNLGISWNEYGRTIHLDRAAYIASLD